MRTTDWVLESISPAQGQDIVQYAVRSARRYDSGPTAAEHPVLSSGLDITLPPTASTAQTARPHSEVRKGQIRSCHATPIPTPMLPQLTSFVCAPACI